VIDLAGSWYCDLADVEARAGIDFSEQDWAPSDSQIYQADADCFCARAKDYIDEYAGTTFATGGGSTTPTNIKEAACMIVLRLIDERSLRLALHGATTVSDEWGSATFTAGTFEIMTPEIRLLIDQDRSDEAFPLRVTTG